MDYLAVKDVSARAGNSQLANAAECVLEQQH